MATDTHHHQWKEGDPEPECWKAHYIRNPCVPIDYPTIQSALDAFSELDMASRKRSGNHQYEIMDDITVYVRPGTYMLSQPIQIQACRRSLRVSIEAMTLPSYTDPLENPPRAELIYRSRKRNEPLVRVSRGNVALKGISLLHQSNGIDIWNGNAAIQVQPSTLSHSHPNPAIPQATVLLQSMEISSFSGRGIVTLDGSYVEVRDSLVHECAATGVYVAGRTSRMALIRSDFIHNGTGNQCAGGIPRGHSGVYAEQGCIEIVDSNISFNSAAGVSVISSDEQALVLKKSDILMNGCGPLELPHHPLEIVDFERNNHIAAVGVPVGRSSVLKLLTKVRRKSITM